MNELTTALAPPAPPVRRAPPTRAMLLLVASGLAPFLAGGVLAAGGDQGGGVPLPCPFRAATGLPCPLCGGTRAFVALGHGSPDVLRYNAALVLLAVALIAAGTLGLLIPELGRRLAGARRRTIVAAVVAGVALSWTWALAHREAIVG